MNALWDHFNRDFQNTLIQIPEGKDLFIELKRVVDYAFEGLQHGHSEAWVRIIDALPSFPDAKWSTPNGVLTVGAQCAATAQIETALRGLHPWRKGPFHLHGVFIDTEWRSDLKWSRVSRHLPSLEGKRILDIGCGNGYYLWRMIDQGASFALGIDPYWLYWVQSQVLSSFLNMRGRGIVCPIAFQSFPQIPDAFDLIFSMGVIYHLRDVSEHFEKIKFLLKTGGTLVVETLVMESGDLWLNGKERYAKMRNIWTIPTVSTVQQWLSDQGFRDVRCVDCTPTLLSEQRATPWMEFESLKDFLNPLDPSLTVEGYPAPMRAVFLAEK
jgi:tRNA (mo5U34)-methyltransferase